MTDVLKPDEQSEQMTIDTTREEDVVKEHKSLPESVRHQVLKRDNYRCQIRGCLGHKHNGSARLLVQVVDKQTVSEEGIDLSLLETRCLQCSCWIAQMPSAEDLRPELKKRLEGVDIEPTWAEILQYLAENGPASTGEIEENVSLNSNEGVRRALYGLMSLDVREESVDKQIVVKDRMEKVYGLPWQIEPEHDARGQIPISPAQRRSRILEATICRVDDVLNEEGSESRELIAEIVDRKPEQVYQMQRRGEAFQFPFSAWADRSRVEPDGAAIIEAVDVLAGGTNNLSRPLLSRELANVYDNNDEPEIAQMLRAWANGESLPSLSESHSAMSSEQTDRVQEEPAVEDNKSDTQQNAGVSTAIDRWDDKFVEQRVNNEQNQEAKSVVTLERSHVSTDNSETSNPEDTNQS